MGFAILGQTVKVLYICFSIWLFVVGWSDVHWSPNIAKPSTLNESRFLNQKSLSGHGFRSFFCLAISFFWQSIILVIGASSIHFSFLLAVGHRHACWYEYSFKVRKVASSLVVAYSLFLRWSHLLCTFYFFCKSDLLLFCRSIRSHSVIRWRVCCS